MRRLSRRNPSQEGTPPGDGIASAMTNMKCWAWYSPVADS